ncbi:MAG: T9SS type A sorting domain-containing protein [Flavobacteriales bacterium]|nr:T9SS type A sorting domain-containing protein [Flavobacteriales bacterium]MCB9446750.1 T9SS type A sorting domain-containing protein [Flavobacteriales bacterium]
MKRKLLFACLTVLSAVVVTDGVWNQALTDPDGSPAACTGNPADNSGKTCAQSGCHTGNSVSPMTGWITWDGPSSNEYTPGATYNITCTATQSGIVRFGFEASVFDAAGAMSGTMAITNSSQTWMRSLGAKKYITHTLAGNSGSTTKSWTFQWTAPSAGKGSAAVYAAFNCANNNGSDTGDKIYTSVLVLTEATNVSVQDIENNQQIGLQVYPQPFRDEANVSFELSQTEQVSVELYNLAGQKVGDVFDGVMQAGTQRVQIERQRYNLQSGVYFVHMMVGNTAYVQRTMVY